MENIKTKTKEVFKVMSLNSENLILVGSHQKNLHYPNDYDLHEIIYLNKLKQPVLNYLVRNIKKIAKYIRKNRSYVYWMELKTLYEGEPLRWTLKDVLKGEIEHKNKSVSLLETLDHSIENRKTFDIKIDVIAWMDRFIEFSNNLKIDKQDDDETKKTLKTELNDTLNELAKDGEYFKFVKKYYLIHPDDEKIKEILNSQVAHLYQIASNFKTIIDLLEKYNNKVVISRCIENLELLRQELNRNEIIKDNELIFKKLNFTKNIKKQSILKISKYCFTKLMKIVNEKTKQKLKEVGYKL